MPITPPSKQQIEQEKSIAREHAVKIFGQFGRCAWLTLHEHTVHGVVTEWEHLADLVVDFLDWTDEK